MKHSLRGVLCGWAMVPLFLGMAAGSLRAADDSDTFTRALAYTNEVYAKNHLTVLADVEWTKGPKQSFRYDRYPEVERVQQEDVSYARKTGGAWLKSEDWAKTGKKIGADKSAELDGLISIVAAALHKNLTPPGTERSIAEIVERRPKDGYEWVIFETRKEKTVTFAHPQFVFAVHGSKDETGMLIGYAGFQRMGDRDLRANLNFSVLFPIKIVESTPEPGTGKGMDSTKTPPSVPPQNLPPDSTSPVTPASLPAPEKGKVYGFMELTLHGKELVGKVVQVEIAPKPAKRTDLHNGLYRVTLFDANPSMPTFGFVDCSDEGLKKLGLEDGSAKKNQKLYLLVGKEKLSGIAKFTAIGTRFEVGKEGMGTYSW